MISNLLTLFYINVTTGNAVLVISDHLEWNKDNHHILILTAKINAHLNAIQNAGLYQRYLMPKIEIL
jgi:hypothetical protein